MRRCEAVLDGIEVDDDHRRFLDVVEVDSIWPQYVTRLRELADAAERWPVDADDPVQRRIDDLRVAASGLTVVWLTLVSSEPVGVEVPAEPLLDAALGYLVSRAGDLMLATPSLTDGLCVELNHQHPQDEYSIVAWGRFSGAG
jgi:hypothetical protein